MVAIARGLRAYLTAVPLIFSLGLIRYVWRTALLSLAVVAAIIPGVAALATYLVAALHHRYFAGVNPILSNAIALGVLLGVLAIGLLLYKHIILVLASPMMSAVAERVGDHLHADRGAFAKTQDLPNSSFWRSLRINARLSATEVLLSAPLLLLSLVPGINLVSTPLLYVVQCYYAGAGLLDVTLERTHDYGQSLTYLRSNRGLAIGVGAGCIALILSIIGLLVLPVWCAAAATVAVCEQDRANAGG